MEMAQFGSIYETVWSVLAICGGLYLLFFREQFIRLNSKAFLRLYEKTGFILFKRQGEEFNSNYMRVVVGLVALIFIGAGVLTLLGFI